MCVCVSPGALLCSYITVVDGSGGTGHVSEAGIGFRSNDYQVYHNPLHHLLV